MYFIMCSIFINHKTVIILTTTVRYCCACNYCDVMANILLWMLFIYILFTVKPNHFYFHDFFGSCGPIYVISSPLQAEYVCI